MSSTNKTANYELSQFVGTDIPSILNDYNGDMRKIDTAIKAVANAEGSSASDIAGLQATVGQHTTEISGLSSTVNSLSGRVIGIEGKIPASASEENKLITNEELTDVSDNVKDIELCIPADASADNKLITENDKHKKVISYNLSDNKTLSQCFNDFTRYMLDNYGTDQESNFEIYRRVLPFCTFMIRLQGSHQSYGKMYRAFSNEIGANYSVGALSYGGATAGYISDMEFVVIRIKKNGTNPDEYYDTFSVGSSKVLACNTGVEFSDNTEDIKDMIVTQFDVLI